MSAASAAMKISASVSRINATVPQTSVPDRRFPAAPLPTLFTLSGALQDEKSVAEEISLEQWPRNVDGEPLAHIATIHLSEAQALLESEDFTEADWPEPGVRLPESGYLEVFHHLGTYGNPEDADTAGWLVQHVPFPGEEF